jgi:hypothetical protein
MALYSRSGMSTLADRPVRAWHEAGRIHVEMASGLELAFPVRGNPRLEGRTDEQLSRVDLSPFGLHWPDLDEDLSIRGILAGDYGQGDRRAA